MTTGTDSPLLRRARSLGADKLFQKPLDPGEVLAWLDSRDLA